MSEEQPQKIENQPSKDERTWAMLCHFSAFTGFIFPLGGNILAPLILWLIKKEELPFVDDQGKEVLNFQISMTIYFIISGILCIILIGIPIFIGLVIFGLFSYTIECLTNLFLKSPITICLSGNFCFSSFANAVTIISSPKPINYYFSFCLNLKELIFIKPSASFCS